MNSRGYQTMNLNICTCILPFVTRQLLPDHYQIQHIHITTAAEEGGFLKICNWDWKYVWVCCVHIKLGHGKMYIYDVYIAQDVCNVILINCWHKYDKNHSPNVCLNFNHLQSLNIKSKMILHDQLLARVTDGLVVREGVSVTWSVLSWSGGHEFEPWSGRTWGA